jgi:crossover junction endodeoxyribonuclease RuvC
MSKEVTKERIILGIDPGTNILGYGLMKEVKSNMELLTMGVIR